MRRFTALLHHVDVDRLRAAYWALEPKATPGVDGVTWQEYGENLQAKLQASRFARPCPSGRVPGKTVAAGAK